MDASSSWVQPHGGLGQRRERDDVKRRPVVLLDQEPPVVRQAERDLWRKNTTQTGVVCIRNTWLKVGPSVPLLRAPDVPALVVAARRPLRATVLVGSGLTPEQDVGLLATDTIVHPSTSFMIASTVSSTAAVGTLAFRASRRTSPSSHCRCPGYTSQPGVWRSPFMGVRTVTPPSARRPVTLCAMPNMLRVCTLSSASARKIDIASTARRDRSSSTGLLKA